MSLLSDALDELEFTNQQLGIPSSEIPAIEPVPLWPGAVFLRQVALFVAPGATGKGLLFARMAGIVSAGTMWPGEPAGTVHEPHSVLLAAPEDDPNEDLAYRLRAASADLSLVRNITYLPDGSRFTLPDNLPELRRAIAEAALHGPEVRLVALDPLMSMTSTSLASARAARAIMDPLLDIARDTNTAIVISHHTTKDSKTVAGNKALTDAARIVWMISRDESDPEGRTRVMQPWKANRIPPGTKIRYKIRGDGPDVRAVFQVPAAQYRQQGSRSSRFRLALPGRKPDARLRGDLVRSLLSQACPEGDGRTGAACQSQRGELCTLGDGITVHSSRITAAVNNGRAGREQVAAQFGTGPLPAGFTR